MGETARQHLELGVGGRPPRRMRLRIVSEFFFGQLGFAGNREHYEDPRNSFLNDVIERRTGIPITLAVVFIEVARRAGLAVEGVNFPGHFLMRCPPEPREHGDAEPLIVDPFHGGAVLSEDDCRACCAPTPAPRRAASRRCSQRAGKRAILLRMLLNLKRLVRADAVVPQARDVADCSWRSTRRRSPSSAIAGCWPPPAGLRVGAARPETFLRLTAPRELDDGARTTSRKCGTTSRRCGGGLPR